MAGLRGPYGPQSPQSPRAREPAGARGRFGLVGHLSRSVEKLQLLYFGIWNIPYQAFVNGVLGAKMNAL